MLGLMKVSLSSSFQLELGTDRCLELQAETIGQMMAALTDRYPAFPALLERGVAVSINGQIFRDDWTQKVPQNAEIFLIPRIEGG